MEYELVDNKLSAADFLRLRESAGWGSLPEQQIEMGIKNSLFTVIAKCNGEIVGMGRIIGDGLVRCYIQDVIVLPAFQGYGIGTAIMKRLMSYINDIGLPDTYIAVGLFAAKGKEDFYTKFGFCVRPNDRRGAGMEMHVAIGSECP